MWDALGTEMRILAVAVVAVAIAASIASLSLRLVFYDALRTNRVRLWRPFLGRLRQAAGLFVVSTALSATVVGPVAVVAVVGNPIRWRAVDVPVVAWRPIDVPVAVIASLPPWATGIVVLAGAILLVIGALALRITHEFVVPVMVAREAGVLAAWRRVGAALRRSALDLVVYLVVHFFVGVGISLLQGVAFVLAASVVAVVGGVVLLVAAVPLGGLGALVGTAAGLVVLAAVGTVAIVCLLGLLAPVAVLTHTYAILYEVSTLAGLDPSAAPLHPDLDPTAVDPVDGDDDSRR
jgi:hypothetical protein